MSTWDPAARASVRAAVLALENALRADAQADLLMAADIWGTVLAGRWLLVDRFDADGRRYIVVRRHELAGRPRGLSAREAQVLERAALGHSNKLIAYELA